MLWVELEEIRKKQELRKDSFRTEMNSDNGIQKIKDQNFGIYLMGEKKLANILEYFQFQTGQKWMYGNIFYTKK